METQTPINPSVPMQAPAEEKKLLLEWIAPSRPFKKRDKDFFTTIIVMGIVFVLILFFMKDLLGILVIVSLIFMVYVLATVPPEDITHQIFTTGIQSGIHFYAWNELIYYSFDAKWGQPMLVAATKNKIPGMIFLLLSQMSKEKIEEIIGTRLAYKESVDSGWMDKSAAWLSKKVPLEKNQPNT